MARISRPPLMSFLIILGKARELQFVNFLSFVSYCVR